MADWTIHADVIPPSDFLGVLVSVNLQPPEGEGAGGLAMGMAPEKRANLRANLAARLPGGVPDAVWAQVEDQWRASALAAGVVWEG